MRGLTMYKHGSEIRHAVNDEIWKLAYATVPLRAGEQWAFLCECGNTHCRRYVSLRLEDFDTIRSSGDDSILASAHPLALIVTADFGIARS